MEKNDMGKYTFSSKNGFCPQCIAFDRRWFIQDRFFGGRYEYCLMSVSTKEPVRYSFKNKSEIAKWLNGDDSNTKYDDTVAGYIISHSTDWRFDYPDRAMVNCRGMDYVYDKQKNVLTAVEERKQETGWVVSYFECLKMAKEILESKNRKISLL